jgi:alanyl-tRNA synthetase
MGKDAITMDFNGVIPKEDLKEIERKANEIVAANVDIQVLYPSKEELQTIEYRSKIEIEGQVRIVRIPDCDTCACCAPHMNKTGEIGIVKLTGMQNYKGGVRVSMLCGFRALEDYEQKSESVKKISVLLSAKENEVAEEVVRVKDEIQNQKMRIAELEKALLAYKVKEISEGQKLAVMFEAELSGNAPRELTNMLLERGIGIAAVFAGNEKDGYRYVIGSKEADTRVLAKKLNEKFHGRGGGKPEMVQGSLSGNEMEIREELESCSQEI